MEILNGKSSLRKITVGRLHFCPRLNSEMKIYTDLTCAEETARLRQADGQAVQQVNRLYERALDQVGEETASIFSTHAMLLEDEDFMEDACRLIQNNGLTAEYAVLLVTRGFELAFADIPSAYMQARAKDVRDVSRRLVHVLKGDHWPDPLEDGPAILVADEFLPSDVMALDHSRLLGMIAPKGSIDSHTAILLRAYQIPLMVEVALDPKWEGQLAVMNGYDHRLYLDPNQNQVETLCRTHHLRGRSEDYRFEERELLAT